MGVISKLRCANCGYQPASRTVFQCPECRRVLEVDVAIDHLGRPDFARMRANRDRSIWRWVDFFPVAKRTSIVSLGEGDTPLIHAARLGGELGIYNLFLKKEDDIINLGFGEYTKLAKLIFNTAIQFGECNCIIKYNNKIEKFRLIGMWNGKSTYDWQNDFLMKDNS